MKPGSTLFGRVTVVCRSPPSGSCMCSVNGTAAPVRVMEGTAAAANADPRSGHYWCPHTSDHVSCFSSSAATLCACASGLSLCSSAHRSFIKGLFWCFVYFKSNNSFTAITEIKKCKRLLYSRENFIILSSVQPPELETQNIQVRKNSTKEPIFIFHCLKSVD